MMDASTSRARATLYVLFSACCFGSIGIFTTIAMRGGARLIDVLFWRYAIAAVLLVLVSGGMTAIRMPARRALPLGILTGGGQAAVAFVTLSALRFIPVATLTFLFYTYPTWVAVISAVRGEERLTIPRVVALALSLSGIALMVGMPGAGGLHPAGVALALFGALLYALYIPMINTLGAGLPPAVTSVFAAGGAAIIFLAATVGQGGPHVAASPATWGAIGMLAVLCTVIAFIVFLRALAVLGPVRTAIISTVEPFWAAILGGLVLGQRLAPRALLGGTLIAAAVILLQLRGFPPEQ